MKWLRRLFSSEPPRPTDLEATLADWRIVKVVGPTGGIVVLRLRINMPESSRGSDYATAVEVGWPYDPNEELPPADVNQQQLEFERAVDELTGENGYSELVLVSTGMGMKQWLFYTTSTDRFMASMNALLTGHQAYPLDIKFYADPGWSIWRETVADVEQRAGDA